MLTASLAEAAQRTRAGLTVTSIETHEVQGGVDLADTGGGRAGGAEVAE